VIAYEPTFAYDAAIIVKDGLQRMLSGENVIYYITLQNEAYVMPAMAEGIEGNILKGLYLFQTADTIVELKADAPQIQLIGSGSILAGVLRAQQTLVREHGVRADVWISTSYNELRREALTVDARNRAAKIHTEKPFVVEQLGDTKGPILAVSDWMRAVPDQIAPWLNGRLTSLGTDGFGLSDTREGLRRHFEVDELAVVQTALWQLSKHNS